MVYLQITLKIEEKNRAAAAAVYFMYKAQFLSEIQGAKSKDLLGRAEDVQVLHGFDTEANAKEYLTSSLFTKDVVRDLKSLLEEAPDIRIYTVA